MRPIPALDQIRDLSGSELPRIPYRAGRTLWVFGYGSLMWEPGFTHAEQQPALLHGYHRDLCVWSVRYRGTPDNPGLVLGLKRGGSCRGQAFRVKVSEVKACIEYLRQRELSTNIYRPLHRPIRLADQRRVDALVFVTRFEHPQFVTNLSQQSVAAILRGASGRRCRNRDYVLNTVAHLRQYGISDRNLERLSELLQDS